MSETKKSRKAQIVLAVTLILVLLTSLISGWIGSSFGKVKVSEIRLVNEENLSLYGRIWIPENAKPETPAPAAILYHGYSNFNNMMHSLATELSRRGYVVIAMDAAAQGWSDVNDAEAHPEWDYGAYAVLQYLGSLPQVDETRIGMVGHSRGNLWNQNAAATAFRNHESDPSVVVPRSLVIASFSFTPIEKLSTGGYGYVLNEYPVSVATIFGAYDEFAQALWNTSATDYTKSIMFSMGAGVRGVEDDTYFVYGINRALTREQAVTAASYGTLRAAFTYPYSHVIAMLADKPLGDTIDFLDITLRDGEAALPREDQVWFGRQVCGFVGLFSFFVMVIALALCLLKTPFFSTLVRREPASLTTLKDKKSMILYVLLFLILQLPTLLLYFYLNGFPGIVKGWQPLPHGYYFSSPTTNPFVLLNLITSAVLIVVILVIYNFIAKKNGATIENLGFKLAFPQACKAVLLALLTFGISYVFLTLCYEITGTYVHFLEFSIVPMDGKHWAAFLKYLPFWLLAYLINSVVFNSITRVNNAKPWVNYLLVVLGGSLSFFLLAAVQYISLYATGDLLITNSGWRNMATTMSSLQLLGIIIITPVSCFVMRILYKKSGSVWAGGILAALLVLWYSLGHSVITYI